MLASIALPEDEPQPSGVTAISTYTLGQSRGNVAPIRLIVWATARLRPGQGAAKVSPREDGKSDPDGAAPLVQCVPINSGSFCQTYR